MSAGIQLTTRADVAQLVEQLTRNEQVVRSNRIVGSIYFPELVQESPERRSGQPLKFKERKREEGKGKEDRGGRKGWGRGRAGEG